MAERLYELVALAAVKFQRLKDREDGQGLVEYGLILTLISVVAVAALTSVGKSVTSVLSQVATDI
jgi:pilus assembly protein Flp/PilA